MNKSVVRFRGIFGGRRSETVSGMDYFDRAYYLRAYPDVAAAGIDPLSHYLTFGWKERRNPSPYFNTRWYLSCYSDIEKAGIEPMQHYARFGRKEDRQPHHLFNASYYLSGSPDVVAAGIDPFLHFVRHGDIEGRSPHPLFDPQFYRRSHPDVGPAPAFAHFSEIGGGRLYSPCPAFDARYYVLHYPDCLIDGLTPLLDYLLAPIGWRRQVHPLIDLDVQRLMSLRSAQGMDPLTDYVQFLSHFNGADVARGATTIPAPRCALLPTQWIGAQSQGHLPKVSVIVPCYKSNQSYLRACLDSVRSQSYQNWELIVLDDGSPDGGATWNYLVDYAERDGRIRPIRLLDNHGISKASNVCIEQATGEFLAFVDHDDIIVPDALITMIAKVLAEKADVAYSNQAYRSTSDVTEEPFYKPCWSPVLFSGVMYVGHLLVIRRRVALDVGLFDSAYDGCQDFEFMLRVSEKTSKIIHVPEILYHWRRAEGSVANDAGAKGKLEPLQARAVNAHFERSGLKSLAVINDRVPHRLAIRPLLRFEDMRIDIIIQGRVNGAGSEAAMIGDRLKLSPARIGSLVMAERRPGAIAKITEGACPYVLFMSADVAVRDETWLDHAVMYARRGGVAFIAPHLMTAGAVVVAAGLATHPRFGLVPTHCNIRDGEDGHAGSLLCDREVSAVSGAFALIDRRVLAAIGGLSRELTSIHFVVAEASLRAGRAGFRNVALAGRFLEVPDDFALEGDGSSIDRQLIFESHRDVLAEPDPYFNRGSAHMKPAPRPW